MNCSCFCFYFSGKINGHTFNHSYILDELSNELNMKF